MEALHAYGRNAKTPEPRTRNALKHVTFIVALVRRRSLAKRKGSIESARRIAAEEKKFRRAGGHGQRRNPVTAERASSAIVPGYRLVVRRPPGLLGTGRCFGN